MRYPLLLLGLLGLTQCAVIKMSASKSESPMARMIQEGTWHDFLLSRPTSIRVSYAGVAQGPVVDHFDGVYSVEISIGVPAQNFSVMLDTAEADTSVIDSYCTHKGCTGAGSGYKKRRFETRVSDTFIPVRDMSWFAERAVGVLGTDVFKVAGIVSDHILGFGLTLNVFDGFASYPVDGVLGLAWPSRSEIKATPVLWELLPQLDAPLFTVWLDARINPQVAHLGGQVTFGGLDNKHCDAQVDYVPLSQQGYWQFPITRFSIGSQVFSSRVEAISDTTRGMLGMPISALNAIIKETGAKFDSHNAVYIVPCKGYYPDIILTIGGKAYNIPSSEYVVYVSLANDMCALAAYEMIGGNGWSPDWSLGSVFIRSYCHVYDIGGKRMGFAKSRNSK